MRRTVLALAVFSATLYAPASTGAQEPSCSWSSDPAALADATLWGVDAADPTNVWAVGSVTNAQGRERTLVRHWDGSEWTRQPSPNVKDQTNRLEDVAAAPDGTAWAVGARSRLTMKTIVQRYDGERWYMQSSLNPSKTTNVLSAVDVTPGGDVYAAGSRWNAQREYRTMIHHYDGTEWSMVPSRIPGLFHDVDVLADDDVWVVGTRVVGRAGRSLAVHFDGTTWTEAELPMAGTRSNVLYGVSAAAPDDVWAVGQYGEGSATRPLVLHYDGSTWSIAELPDLGSSDIELRDVSAVAPDFAVIVGQRSYDFGEDSRVILEWDGTAWSEAPRDDELESNWLHAVDVAPDRTAWAVGYHSTRPQTSYALRRTCT